MSKRIAVWIGDRPGRSLTLEWHDPKTGKRRQKSAGTDDYQIAEQRRRDLEYELRRGLYLHPSQMAWGEFVERWRAERGIHLRPRALAKVETVLALFAEIAKPKRLESVDDASVSRFAATMAGQVNRRGHKYRPVTIRVYLGALRAVLRWAKSQKLIAACPEFPPIEVPRKKPALIATESVDRLLAACPDERWRALVVCGCLAGLRLSEALELRSKPSKDKPWVDWKTRSIFLPAEFVKAGEDQALPMAADLATVLEAVQPIGDRYFAMGANGQPIHVSTASRRIVGFAKRAGVKISMHDLRRYFISQLAKRVPASVLQALARHADLKTTMQYYANVSDAMRGAVEYLNGVVALDVAHTNHGGRESDKT